MSKQIYKPASVGVVELEKLKQNGAYAALAAALSSEIWKVSQNAQESVGNSFVDFRVKVAEARACLHSSETIFDEMQKISGTPTENTTP